MQHHANTEMHMHASQFVLYTESKFYKNTIMCIHTSFIQKLWRTLFITEVNFSDHWTLIFQA